MLRRVALVKADLSEQRVSTITGSVLQLLFIANITPSALNL
jgi:hypothetical protein